MLGQQGAGAADLLYETGNTSLFASTGYIDANGTTANYWSTFGFWTPSGDQDFSTTDAAIKEWFDLSDMQAAGDDFIVVFRSIFTASSALSANENLVDLGRNGTSGGYEIVFSTNRNWLVGYKANGGSIVNKAQNNVSADFGVEMVMGFYFDLNSHTPRVYSIRDGNPTLEFSDDLETPIPTPAAAQPFRLFGQGGSNLQRLGNGGSGMKICDLRFIRCPAARSQEKFYEITREMAQHPRRRRLKALSA